MFTVSKSACFGHHVSMKGFRRSDRASSSATPEQSICVGKNATPVSKPLASIGVILLGVAAVGFLMNKSAAEVTAFLVVGAGLVLVAVLLPRLEGPVEVGPTGAKVNLARLAVVAEQAAVAEQELNAGSLTTLEDLKI
jgi:hypothetical protein